MIWTTTNEQLHTHNCTGSLTTLTMIHSGFIKYKISNVGISNSTTKMKLTILAFLYYGQFVKTSI